MKLKLYLIIAFILTASCLHARPNTLDITKNLMALNDKADTKNDAYQNLDHYLDKKSNNDLLALLSEWGKFGTQNEYFQSRFDCLNARFLYKAYFYQRRTGQYAPKIQQDIQTLMVKAMTKAYHTEDEYLIAFISGQYGKTIGGTDIGAAVVYSVNSVKLYEKLGVDISPYAYQVLTEKLYRVQAYNDCIKYCNKALQASKKTVDFFNPLSVINTIGESYCRQKMYDSAFKYYNRVLLLAQQRHDLPWVGIVSGNMARIYLEQGKPDIARALFAINFNSCMPGKYYDEAAGAKQGMAKADLASGRTLKALAEIRAAFGFLKLWHNDRYLNESYLTAMQIFKAAGRDDSAFYYYDRFRIFNDSLQKITGANSLSILKARLNDQASIYHIQTLNQQKEAEITARNAWIGTIMLVSIIVLLILNRKTLKSGLQAEKATREKDLIEQEMTAAKEQLQLFTDNLVEKSVLIGKLELELRANKYPDEQQILKELTSQPILTEDDWLKFKALFEKAYPGFFIRLREKLADITLAEQRIAALTLLQLTTRQMADLLGISPNSVIKGKQRLRQRFELPTNLEVEETIAKL